MAFTIKLYNVSDDPRKLNKTLTGELSVNNVRPTDIVDLMNPSFILDYNESYTTKNYLYAAAPFDRYYFITDMKIDIGKKIVISCAVDVLQTYKEDINTLEANVIRQQDKRNPFFADDEYNFKVEYQNEIEKFPTSHFQSGSYIIMWIGGPESGFILITDEPADWETAWRTYYVYRAGEGYVTIGSILQTDVTPSFDIVYRTYSGVYYTSN